MAVCVPALMNKFPNVLRVAEFVEMYKILGATRFYFYNASMTEDVNKILHYYQDTDNVTVYDWKLDGIFRTWKI